MRVSVNLATRPFVELRPFFVKLRVLMAVLAVAAIAAAVAAHVFQKKLDVANDQIARLHVRTVAAQLEKQGNERRMRQPDNAAVLERAHFLNSLFLRKSFSWTAVMMDLETVLPSGVEVTSIEPQIGTSGDVIIRLRVSGERDRAVQLVRNLERSRRFLLPRLTGEAVQTKDSSSTTSAANAAPAGVEFEILANYNPLPEGQVYPKVRPADSKQAGTATGNVLRASKRSYGVVLKPFSGTTASVRDAKRKGTP
jgi:type IV pilus assembly protein PilN